MDKLDCFEVTINSSEKSVSKKKLQVIYFSNSGFLDHQPINSN